jgi:hypothetical protein
MSTQASVSQEADVHCKKFGKVAKLVSCENSFFSYCAYKCEPPSETYPSPLQSFDTASQPPTSSAVEVDGAESENKAQEPYTAKRLKEVAVDSVSEPGNNSTEPLMSFDKAKEKCASLGFAVGTEKFGSCVMQLIKL